MSRGGNIQGVLLEYWYITTRSNIIIWKVWFLKKRPLRMLLMRGSLSRGVNVHTVRCRYNVVKFLPKPHKRHPISRPWGRGMGCLLWVQPLIRFCSSRCCAAYDILFYWTALWTYLTVVGNYHARRNYTFCVFLWRLSHLYAGIAW